MENGVKGVCILENKKRICVQVCGRSYAVLTDDDEKYVYKVAEDVSKHIRSIISSTSQLDVRDCAVLAALDFCDDLYKAEKKKKECVSKADKIIKQTNELNKLCNEYKQRLAEAINENTALLRKYKKLEKENEQLKKAVAENNEDDKVENLQNSAFKKTKSEFSVIKQYSLFDDSYEK